MVQLKTYNEALEDFLSTVPKQTDRQVATDVFNYVWRQINERSKLGVISDFQLDGMLRQAILGLFIEVFIKNYTHDTLEMEPLYISGKMYLILMFSQVHRGRARDLEEQEIAAKQAVSIVQK